MLLVLGVNAMSRRVVCVNSPTRLDVVLRAGLAVGAPASFNFSIDLICNSVLSLNFGDSFQIAFEQEIGPNWTIRCRSKYSPVISKNGETKTSNNEEIKALIDDKEINSKTTWTGIWEYCVCLGIMKHLTPTNVDYYSIRNEEDKDSGEINLTLITRDIFGQPEYEEVTQLHKGIIEAATVFFRMIWVFRSIEREKKYEDAEDFLQNMSFPKEFPEDNFDGFSTDDATLSTVSGNLPVIIP